MGTHRPLVRIFLHQLKVSLPGTMELILVTELLHCAQQVVDDGFKVRAVQVLQYEVEGLSPGDRTDDSPPPIQHWIWDTI